MPPAVMWVANPTGFFSDAMVVLWAYKGLWEGLRGWIEGHSRIHDIGGWTQRRSSGLFPLARENPMGGGPLFFSAGLSEVRRPVAFS